MEVSQETDAKLREEVTAEAKRRQLQPEDLARETGHSATTLRLFTSTGQYASPRVKAALAKWVVWSKDQAINERRTTIREAPPGASKLQLAQMAAEMNVPWAAEGAPEVPEVPQTKGRRMTEAARKARKEKAAQRRADRDHAVKAMLQEPQPKLETQAPEVEVRIPDRDNELVVPKNAKSVTITISFE